MKENTLKNIMEILRILAQDMDNIAIKNNSWSGTKYGGWSILILYNCLYIIGPMAPKIKRLHNYLRVAPLEGLQLLFILQLFKNCHNLF